MIKQQKNQSHLPEEENFLQCPLLRQRKKEKRKKDNAIDTTTHRKDITLCCMTKRKAQTPPLEDKEFKVEIKQEEMVNTRGM